ncbi:MAG: YcaO-like family protein, partial [bacterium]
MQEPKINKTFFDDIQTINSLLTKTRSSFLVQDTRVFYDEPPFYFFSGLLTNNLDYLSHQGYCSTPEHIVAGGFSFESRSLAVLKCIAELAERFSLFNFETNIVSQYSHNAHPSSLSPSHYRSNVEDTVLGWVSATNLASGEMLSVPAQLVYLNYFSHWAKKNNPQEPRLCQYISNGACFGFDKETTMLRGLYELIERDAALTLYLTHYAAPRIDIEAIDHPTLVKCVEMINRYHFKVFVFNMTNDLTIPTFLTILVDESPVGPHVTAGLKTSLNPIDAIIGSMEESFMGRTWVRHELMKGAHPEKIKPT